MAATPLPPNLEAFQRQFKQPANAVGTLPTQQFPALFDAITRKFPDLKEELDAVEKSIAEWVKSVQSRQ